MQEFLSALKARPIIAAVRDEAMLKAAIASGCGAVFILGGDILTLPSWTYAIKGAGKYAFMHMDLCEGLGRDMAAVEFCARAIRPSGIISTRAPLIKRAGELGLLTIQRIFLMDSQGLENGIRLLKHSSCDMVEVLPGLVPKAIRRLASELGKPIIAGGMITQLSEALSAYDAGAVAVSTSERSMW